MLFDMLFQYILYEHLRLSAVDLLVIAQAFVALPQ